MTRSLSVAALIAAGFSFSALATDDASVPATDTAAVAAYTAQLSAAAKAQNVRRLLQAQGFTSVSDLNRDDDGRWTGTAVKDGKTMGVSVILPPKGSEVGVTN